MSHTLSKKSYLKVWLALMVLLALTWIVARFNLGGANTILALSIAFLKMVLVMLFFMQVRMHSRLVWLFSAAGFLWLLFMLSLTMMDYLTRKTVTPYEKSIHSQIAVTPPHTQAHQ
jgi:cytochrome c oxidase subunit 4